MTAKYFKLSVTPQGGVAPCVDELEMFAAVQAGIGADVNLALYEKVLFTGDRDVHVREWVCTLTTSHSEETPTISKLLQLNIR